MASQKFCYMNYIHCTKFNDKFNFINYFINHLIILIMQNIIKLFLNDIVLIYNVVINNY